MKRVVALILIVIIICSSFVSAKPLLEKDETVYVNLDYYGAIDEINVYNSYITNGLDCIVDYADYQSVTNLTDKQDAVKLPVGIKFNTKGLSNFSYMGRISNDKAVNIPWDFNVAYKLNGVVTTPDKLLRAHGLVEIDIDINANCEAKEYYRNNYLLEVTSSFNMEDYLSVESDNAVFVTTGKTKTLMFIVLPGQSSSFNLKIGSEDFKMGGITFAAIPLTGELLEDITDIVEDKEDIEDASCAVDESTDILLNALSGMTSSLNSLKSGILNLKNGGDNLYNLKDKRNSEITSFKKSLENMAGLIDNSKKDLANLKNQINDFMDVLEEIQDLTKGLEKKSNSLLNSLDLMEDTVEKLPSAVGDIRYAVGDLRESVDDFRSLLRAQLNASKIDTRPLENNLVNIASKTSDIAQLVQTGVAATDDVAVKSNLLEIGQSASSIATSMGVISENITDIKALIDDTTTVSDELLSDLKSMSEDLRDIKEIFDTKDAKIIVDTFTSANSFLKELDKSFDILNKYNKKFLGSEDNNNVTIDDLDKILDEVNSLNDIFINLTGTLQSSLNIIDTDVYNGMMVTSDGLVAVTNDLMKITDESDIFRNSKNKIKDIIDNRMDEMEAKTTLFNIDKNAKAVSFTSDSNSSPSLVQFMFKTPDISEASLDVVDLEPENVDEGFFNRFIGIFKKIWEAIVGILK